MTIKELFAKIPTPVLWAVGVVLVVILGLTIWYKGTQIWNGVGNYLFHRKADVLSKEVQDQLNQAAEQKKALEKTLIELAVAKSELERAKKAREEAENIFNDKNKTAKEKVAAYEALMSAPPIHTDPNGVTMSDLCARAKASGSNPELIAALCN